LYKKDFFLDFLT